MPYIPNFQAVVTLTPGVGVVVGVGGWGLGVGGGRFKNTYEFLNLRGLKFSTIKKIYIFQCMGYISCVDFERATLKFHTNYLTHTLKYTIVIQSWNFKLLDLRARNCFWNAPWWLIHIFISEIYFALVPVTDVLCLIIRAVCVIYHPVFQPTGQPIYLPKLNELDIRAIRNIFWHTTDTD